MYKRQSHRFLVGPLPRRPAPVDALHDALSGYLEADVYKRQVQDGFEGSERADSIMLVNVAPNGQAVALSIPRDTYAEIPGVGWDKINASYAYGGPQLLVETVEKLTGLTVDHFVQIGMGAVPDMVAVSYTHLRTHRADGNLLPARGAHGGSHGFARADDCPLAGAFPRERAGFSRRLSPGWRRSVGSGTRRFPATFPDKYVR